MELELAEWVTGEPPPPKAGFFRKHWRGDYGLARSFWVNGLVVQAVHMAVWGVIVFLVQSAPAHHVARLVLLFWMSSIAIWVWANKGIWSSAAREIREEVGRFWQRAAQVAVVVGVVVNLLSVLPLLPSIHRILQIASGKQPWPLALVDLSLDKSAIVVRGALHHRVSDEVERLLEMHPSVQYLSLDSEGGWLREGTRLAALVNRHGLKTYTRNECSSACTLPFLAGEVREVAREGKIGFHSSSSFLGPADGGNRVLRSAYRAAGLSRPFIEFALSVPANEMYYPEVARMYAEHIATQVVEERPFDPMHMWRVSRTAFGKALILYVHPFEALAKNHPDIFAPIVDQGWEMLLEGMDLDDVIDYVVEKAHDAFDQALPLLDEEFLVELHSRLRTVLAQYRLRDANHPTCTAILHRGGRAAPKLRITRNLLLQSEATVDLVYRHSSEANRQIIRESTLEAAIEPLLKRLTGRQIDFLFAKENERISPPGGSCSTIIAYMDALATLPTSKRMTALRSVYDRFD